MVYPWQAANPYTTAYLLSTMPIPPPHISTPGGMEERIGRVKLQYLMGWDKDSLQAKQKLCTKAKWNKFFYYFPSAGRWSAIQMKAGYLGRHT